MCAYCPLLQLRFVESLGLSLGLVNDTKCAFEVNVSFKKYLFFVSFATSRAAMIVWNFLVVFFFGMNPSWLKCMSLYFSL